MWNGIEIRTTSGTGLSSIMVLGSMMTFMAGCGFLDIHGLRHGSLGDFSMDIMAGHR